MIKRIHRTLHQVFKQSVKMASTKSIKEGQAEICVTSEKVFYNPVQEFNRDLSIAVLTVFSQDYRAERMARAKRKDGAEGAGNESEAEVTILEALSATGLRSIRYAKEIPNITKIVANDLSEQAVDTIKANIVHNKVENVIETSHDDACMLMYKHKHPAKRFAAIDLDPYGCPSIFLDSAVQSVQDGGLLLVTATDMAVLAGNSPETCYCKYGAISLRTKSCHEMALRILLQCIESHANRYSRYIVPLLSISADFYIRVFVKLYSGAIHCKKTTSKLSMAYQCVGCDTITLQPLGGFKPNPTEKNPGQTKAYLPAAPTVQECCVHCNQRHRLGGPIWSAAIHDQSFVSRVLAHVESSPALGTRARLEGTLSVVCEELQAPLYYTLDKLFGTVHCETMPMLLFRSALLNAGYAVSYSHASKLSIKTTAPSAVVWDVVRTWERERPVKQHWKESDPVTGHILSSPPSHLVALVDHPSANPLSRRAGRTRYPPNPQPQWGPGARAHINVGEEKLPKAIRNQNKKSRAKNSDTIKQDKDTNTTKRGHSPEEEARKKPGNNDTENAAVDQTGV